MTSKQRAYLRGVASKYDTVFQVGKGGVGEKMTSSVGDALEAHELVKITTLDNSEYGPREAAEEMAAALGAEVEVPTLDGKVKLTIPEGTQPGAVFRLRGKGIPYLRGSGRVDLFVSVNITVPKNLNSHQKEALREFAATMGEEHAKSGIFGKKRK